MFRQLVREGFEGLCRAQPFQQPQRLHLPCPQFSVVTRRLGDELHKRRLGDLGGLFQNQVHQLRGLDKARTIHHLAH